MGDEKRGKTSLPDRGEGLIFLVAAARAFTIRAETRDGGGERSKKSRLVALKLLALSSKRKIWLVRRQLELVFRRREKNG